MRFCGTFFFLKPKWISLIKQLVHNVPMLYNQATEDSQVPHKILFKSLNLVLSLPNYKKYLSLNIRTSTNF